MSLKSDGKHRRDKLTPREVVFAAISGIVLLAAIYILVCDDYSASTSKWAIGIIGAIVGYWAK